MDSNKKIHLKPGLATKIVNGVERPVNSFDAPDCNCGFDTCDCAVILTDLSTGAKFALYFLDGALSFSAIADFEAYKASDDVADLNETVIAEV